MPTIQASAALFQEQSGEYTLHTAATVVKRLLASDEIHTWQEAAALVRLQDKMGTTLATLPQELQTVMSGEGYTPEDVARTLTGQPFEVSDAEYALLKRVVDRAADPTAFADTDPSARFRGVELAAVSTILGGLACGS